ncbi:MAG: glycosyltransferase family 2 protein [Chlorobiaceae bacterium]|nr:glycosyltransferase family 2 protein [Chlorobiaceae bacterium]
MNTRVLTFIIVLNWNAQKELLRCLASLRQAMRPDMRILVVDNGSTDGSVAAVRGKYPEVELLELPENLGYAGGNNAGFRHLLKGNPDYVIFLNNDTVVAVDFATPLIDRLENDSGTGITVAKICQLHSPGTLWYAGGEVRLQTGLIRHRGIRRTDGPEFSIEGETGYATGCCFAMRSRDFLALGGFDERFGMYAEDVDLSLRVRERGMKVVYVPEAQVWHDVSASYGSAVHPRKLLQKTSASLRLFLKYRAWSGLVLFFLLMPFRLAASMLDVLFLQGLTMFSFRRGGHS